MIRTYLRAATALAAFALAPAVQADLPKGAKAPVFVTQGALAGKVFGFDLKAALRKGPVVLYFYPKSFTQGCTLEAHGFAEAMDQFRASGATVIGLSADDIATQQKFSREACRDAFPVGVASPTIVAAYDVALKREGMPAGLTTRTSYVIGRDGRIKFAFTDMNYRDHVRLTLAAVKSLRGK
ncbi:peroxiredoxin [Novosphingobium kunmingense]|uniref:thioredoxin-dependent peroxiredoxin n=1 Tax=Novosphingobium kunmingense TaxID=1211806 RepID=A0A2N0I341_9SPHN|nr:peroxiredoxin [Novosphingobium kunmingense]PKB25575.1 peroxiredoxin [Novosphingobium kunmingense]